MSDVLCCNDTFSEQDWAYFRRWGIQTPLADKVYSIREIVRYPTSEAGLLLNEIINPLSPKISPSFNIEGKAEQSFKISRFKNLDGTELKLEEINKIKEKL